MYKRSIFYMNKKYMDDLNEYHFLNETVNGLLKENKHQDARDFLEQYKQSVFYGGLKGQIETHYNTNVRHPEFLKQHAIYMKQSCIHGYPTKCDCCKCNWKYN